MGSLTSKTGSPRLLSSRSQWVFRVEFWFRSRGRCSHSIPTLITVRSYFLFRHFLVIVLFSYNIKLLLMITIIVLRSAIRNLRIIYLSLSRHPVLNTSLGTCAEASSFLRHHTPINRSPSKPPSPILEQKPCCCSLVAQPRQHRMVP